LYLSQPRGPHYEGVVMISKDERLFSFLISFASIKLGKELGRGAFGIVYKAELNGQAIACKMLSKETAQEMNQDEFLQEARTMSEIPRHPNVIQLLGFCRDETICILSGMENKGSQEKRNIDFSKITHRFVKQNSLEVVVCVRC
jgi:serine/threonine protein kinase